MEPKHKDEKAGLRIQRFVGFFKNYMGVGAVMTALLPIPFSSLHFIPTYSAQTSVLSTYTSLFCFLLLGFIFYSRHRLARLFFIFQTDDKRTAIRANILKTAPFALMILSLGLVFGYHYILNESINYSLENGEKVIMANLVRELSKQPEFKETASKITWDDLDKWEKEGYQALMQKLPVNTIMLERAYNGDTIVLKIWPRNSIRYGNLLMGLYLGIFICAEGAFILMALKEYLQDILEYSDVYLIWPDKAHQARDRAQMPTRE